MFLEILGPIFVLFVLFYGSKRDASGTRINFLGYTLYERRRDPALPRTSITISLGSGNEGEDDERDGDAEDDDASEEDDAGDVARDLWDRFTDAGFTVIDEDRDIRLTDIGAIKTSPCSNHKCAYCKEKTHDLYEVYENPPEKGARIGVALRTYLGCVCARCGHVQDLQTIPQNPGTLSKFLTVNVNFFDALDYLEQEKAGDDGVRTEQVSLEALEARRDELEGKLNVTRHAILRKQQESAEGQPHRGPMKPESETTPVDRTPPELKTTP